MNLLLALYAAGLSWFGFKPVSLGQVTNDTIAHWSFDEGFGTNALDSSGNNLTGTITGAVYLPGRLDNALSFNGASQYVFSSDAQSGGVTGRGLDMGTRDWTVAAWVKTTASGMVVTKMGFVGGANPDGWGMAISGNGTLGAVLHKSGVGTVNIFAGDGATVNDGQWHHVAVVFNRAGEHDPLFRWSAHWHAEQSCISQGPIARQYKAIAHWRARSVRRRNLFQRIHR
jgi:hypothetical protein